jgi:phosphotransferase system enzyme I (PtsI)
LHPRQASAAPSNGDPHERLRQAQADVARGLEQLGAALRAENKPDEAAIFEAQALLATDPALISQVQHHLTTGATSVESAVGQATETLAAQIGAVDDPYLRERAADVRAVGRQLIEALSGAVLDDEVPAGTIVLADELSPSQLMALRRRGMLGFATVQGAPTGHVALLARALELPALLGLDPEGLAVADGRPTILVARAEAQLIVDPTPDELAWYASLEAERQADVATRQGLLLLPTATADGHPVELWANLGRPEEAEPALESGAEGVGLFRTEFLFLDRQQAPSEDEQYAAYVHVLQAMGERPVVVRTLDVGGDKPLPYLPPLAESNPFLGARGIRFCMRHPELFRSQLRALVRAAKAGKLRIMLPMVATPDDVAWARQQLASLDAVSVPLGIMVETPAAAVTLDRLAQDIQFCSIGSNDLAQYALAADRGDASLAQRYRPDDPAVLRLIRQTVESAHRLKLEVSLCGELAADPSASVALVGLGLDKLSMAPPALLEVKAALRAVTLEEAREAAAAACGERA